MKDRLAWLPLVTVAVLNQIGTWTSNWPLAQAGQALFVPAAVVGITLLGARWQWPTLAAFIVYWCGDLLPMVTGQEWRELALATMFMVGHVLLLIGTRNRLATHPRRARTTMVVAAAVSALAIIAALVWAPWLAPWIGMYAVLMTVLAGRLAGFSAAGLWGAVAFLLSNSILAARLIIGAYGGLLSQSVSQLFSSLTMALYAVGLALVATAVAGGRTEAQRIPAPAH